MSRKASPPPEYECDGDDCHETTRGVPRDWWGVDVEIPGYVTRWRHYHYHSVECMLPRILREREVVVKPPRGERERILEAEKARLEVRD